MSPSCSPASLPGSTGCVCPAVSPAASRNTPGGSSAPAVRRPMATSTARSAAALWVLVLALSACRPAEKVRDWPRGELHSGSGPISAPLRVGEVHRYRLPLTQGTLLRLVVDQQGIDAKIACAAPTGAFILEAGRRMGPT